MESLNEDIKIRVYHIPKNGILRRYIDKNWVKMDSEGIIEIDSISLFRIGSNKNKNILWFNNINKPNIHLLLNMQENKYQIIDKTFNKQQIEQSIDIPTLSERVESVKRKEKINLIDETKINCYKRCRIL